LRNIKFRTKQVQQSWLNKENITILGCIDSM